MYAIFKDGGHQHKAEVGRKMFIELRKDANVGDTIEFNEVLLIGSEEGVAVGQPNVEGAKVVATVLGEVKGPKVVIRWFRRRKNSRRKNGHRQQYTEIEIKEIVR